MSDVYSLFIPIKPVPWSRPRFDSRSKAVFNSGGLRAYERALGGYFRIALASGQMRPIAGDVFMRLTFYLQPPKRKVRERPGVKPDLSNLVKAVEDAANGILWNDDSQVVILHAKKAYDWEAREVGVEIRIEELPAESVEG